MIAKLKGASITRLKARIIDVEVLILNGLPEVDVVGISISSVHYSLKRVISAIKNVGIKLAPKHISVNIGVSELKNNVSHLDMALAAGMLTAYAYLDKSKTDNYLWVGELRLDGSFTAVKGIISIIEEAVENGIKKCVIPAANYREASCICGIDIIYVNNINELIEYVREGRRPDIVIEEKPVKSNEYLDFSDVLGQEGVKRAAVIAAAGMHSILLIGRLGSGKSMCADRIGGILPEQSEEERLSSVKLYSMAGLDIKQVYNNRPVRSIAPTIKDSVLIGSTLKNRPGELALSNNGILYMDELSEYSPHTLSLIRQAMDERKISIQDDNETIELPAHFLLIACTNGCKCGAFPDMSKCICTIPELLKFGSKVSQTFYDRFDVSAIVSGVRYEELSGERVIGTSSADMKGMVNAAFERQRKRYKGKNIHSNGGLGPDDLGVYCKITDEQSRLLQTSYEKMGMSARSCHNILKVSRTIADLEESEEIKTRHLVEAIGLRSIDRSFWKL